MLEESMFTKEKLIKEVKSIYGIDVFNVEKMGRGSANIYSLNNDEYILKEFQSKYTKEEIDKEIIIINHLKGDGIPVPEYIKTISGDYSFIYKGRIVIMQRFIDGYVMDSNTGTINQIMESAMYLGKIIKSLETLEISLPNNDISSWYSIDTINESIEKINNLLEQVSIDTHSQIYNDLNDKITC